MGSETDPDSAGSGLRAAIIHSLADAAREGDGPDVMAVESPSQRKRPRPGADQSNNNPGF